LDEIKSDYNKNLKNFSTQININSIENQIKELQNQLYHEYLIRDKELIELYALINASCDKSSASC